MNQLGDIHTLVRYQLFDRSLNRIGSTHTHEIDAWTSYYYLRMEEYLKSDRAFPWEVISPNKDISLSKAFGWLLSELKGGVTCKKVIYKEEVIIE